MPKSFIALGSSRRRNLFCGTAVGVLLTIGAAERVYATCTPAAPTGAADITSCSGAFGVVNSPAVTTTLPL